MLLKILLVILLILCVGLSVAIIVILKNKTDKSSSVKYVSKDPLLVKQNKLLKDIMKAGNSEDDLKTIAGKITESLSRVYNIDYCTIYMIEDDILKLKSTDVPMDQIENIQNEINKFITGKPKHPQVRSAQKGNTLSYSGAKERGITYSILIPVQNKNNTIAVFFIEKTEYNNEFEDDFFNIAMDVLSLAVSNAIKNNIFKERANKDNLTNLYNRRYLEEITNSYDLLNKNKLVTSVLLDIDYFKKVNDTYGHPAGDKVLRTLSETLKDNLNNTFPENSKVFRYGGEEFLILINDVDKYTVKSFMEKVRLAVEDLTVVDGEYSIKFTISAGVTDMVVTSATDLTAIIKTADEGLYEAKKTGRNRIIIKTNN